MNCADLLPRVALESLLMGVYGTIVLVFAFQVKHLIVAFLLQPPYMWKNKGKLFHPGGWLHAGLHGVTTFLLIWKLSPAGDDHLRQIFLLSLGETLAHFLIDFAKVNVCEYFGWRANTSPNYWYMLGLDQFLHQVCYLVITLLYLTTL